LPDKFHTTGIGALSSQKRWATCVLAQLGFIRLSSNPTAVATAKSRLKPPAYWRAWSPIHCISTWIPFRRPLPKIGGTRFENLLGHQQVTDAYLLSLAAANNAALITFSSAGWRTPREASRG